MRRVVAKVAGKAGPALMMALVVTLALAAVGSAQQPAPPAPAQPLAPNYFYGKVATDQGKPLPAGTEVTVKAVTGGWTGTATAKVDALSRYGYEPPFYVPGLDPHDPGSGAQNNDKIAFYVLGVQARLYDVLTGKWSDTYPFKSFATTNLDLEVALSYTISATAGPHGSIEPSGAVKVNYGFDKTFTIKPDAGFKIADVKVDGASNPGAVASGSYTFSNVTANHTIEATFKSIYYLPLVMKAG